MGEENTSNSGVLEASMEISTHPAESHHPDAPSGGSAWGLEEEYSFVPLRVKYVGFCSFPLHLPSPSHNWEKTDQAHVGRLWEKGPLIHCTGMKTVKVSTKINMDLLSDPALFLFFARN